MVVNCEKEAYKLYNEYAIQIGFCIRKNKIIYSKNGVRQRGYVCSKEGFPRDKNPCEIKNTTSRSH